MSEIYSVFLASGKPTNKTDSTEANTEVAKSEEQSKAKPWHLSEKNQDIIAKAQAKTKAQAELKRSRQEQNDTNAKERA